LKVISGPESEISLLLFVLFLVLILVGALSGLAGFFLLFFFRCFLFDFLLCFFLWLCLGVLTSLLRFLLLCKSLRFVGCGLLVICLVWVWLEGGVGVIEDIKIVNEVHIDAFLF